MGTNIDRPTDGGQRAGDDETRGAGPDGPPRRDAEAARRSFAADERAAEAGRERPRSRDPERGENDWNAVGLVTSLGVTFLFGVGGVLARSVHLTTAASLAFVTAGLLFARWCRHRRG